MQAYRGWLAFGALVGLLAVIAAAFAAHGTADAFASRARAHYVLAEQGDAQFCGAVYSPAFGGPSLGMTAPVGGGLLMFGWIALGVSALVR